MSSEMQNIGTSKVAPEGAAGDKKDPSLYEEYKGDKFSNQFEYWLACIGFAVGFGNVWRFPYMLYSNGGVVFLIPYLCCLFFVAVPMYLCETAYGQLIEMKLQCRFGAINQRWWAIILCQTCVCFFTCIYYITLMAWSFSYFFDAFVDPLPWLKDGAAQATKLTELWNPDYFYKETLKASEGADQPGNMVGPLVGCMFLSYVFTYFSVWRGLKSTGKMVYVTCLLPYLILTVLFIRGLTLDGCGDGLSALFDPDWSHLGKVLVWKNAATQILFSSGVSYGPLMYYGTGREKDHKLKTISYMIPAINSLTSFYASLTIFTFLGHVSKNKKIPVFDLAKSGPELLFVVFPALLGLLPWQNFFSVIFFAMCLCLGVDSVFGFVDFFMQLSEDFFPQIRKKMKKEVWCIIVCLFCFIWSLMFCIEGGLYVFNLFDGYSGNIQLLFCLMSELVFIGFLFGLDNLETLMFLRTGERIPAFVKFFFKVVIPIFIFIIYVLGWVAEFQYQGSRVDARWTAGILWAGRLLWIVPLLLIPLGMIKNLQYPCPDIWKLIEVQYGVSLKDEKNDWTQDEKTQGFRVVDQAIVNKNYGNPPKAEIEAVGVPVVKTVD